MIKPLSPKQRAFVTEYLKDHNGTQAAIRAGYSVKTANEQAARLLVNVSIKDAIQEAQSKAEKRAILTYGRALEILAEIAETANREGDRIAAINQTGKFEGWEAAKNINVDATVKKQIDVSGLSDEELERITTIGGKCITS